ncbi:hypothetical protein [Streptomyces siamensis]|uniref:Uncharacterized protein n=1 Tax=Streptomyces siamensis TaxID=1274986 RepID=A0ABP9IPG8_9ACTN
MAVKNSGPWFGLSHMPLTEEARTYLAAATYTSIAYDEGGDS